MAAGTMPPANLTPSSKVLIDFIIPRSPTIRAYNTKCILSFIIGGILSVEVIINGHRENGLIKHAIDSAFAAMKNLSDFQHVGSSVTVVLDKSDGLTKKVTQGFQGVRVLETDFGDLGLARNYGVSQSRANYIAFLDADDLFSSNWLELAWKISETSDSDVVCHPEINYYFGHAETQFSRTVSRHLGSDDPNFPIFGMSTMNPWTALCFAPRRLLLDTPYLPVSRETGNGFEDWTFNLQTMAKGIKHTVVPKTAHFIRDKPGTRMRAEHSSRGAVFLPTQLWANKSKFV